MQELHSRILANMEVALETACRGLLHGGDHAHRKAVAERLMEAARSGQTSLSKLDAIARRAASELAKRT